MAICLSNAISSAFSIWRSATLKVDAWNTAATAITSTGDPLRVNCAIPVALPTGRGIDAVYATQMDNVEFDVHLPCETVSWLVGFSYIESLVGICHCAARSVRRAFLQ